MRESIRNKGAQYACDVTSGHRALLEKALYMRAQSYLADVKAQLLTKTIFEVDDQRKLLKAANEKLADSMAALQRKKVEFAIEVAWRKAIFNTESVGVLVVDEAGVVIETNHRFRDMTGRKREQVEGLRLEELFCEGGSYRLFRERLYGLVGEGSGVAGMEFPLQRSDGSLLWCAISANAISPRDVSKGAVCAFVDISAYKKAREDAESANRAKSIFLSNMSHELRTPLNAILGCSRLLGRDTTLDQSVRDGLSVIEQSGRHLLTLINDILDLSKVEAQKLQLLPRPLHLPSVLEGVLAIVSVQAQEKGVVLQSEIDTGGLVSIEADEKRLRQILLNLLGNAVKFTDRGRVVLRVTPLQGYGPESQFPLRFEVEDTGRGIAPEDRQRIFSPFEQAGTGDGGEGTGLGLAISQQLVRHMGGGIKLESEVGTGSRFWFDLAFAPVRDLGHCRQAQKPLPSGYKGPRRQVLVVDDEEVNRLVFRRALEKVGVVVHLASGGQEALRSLCDHRADLVLMDLTMPEMDGYSTLEQLHRDHSLRRIPVVAMATGIDEEQVARALKAGFCGFIAKPLEVDDLIRVLGSQLGLEWLDVGYEGQAEEPQGEAVPPPTEELMQLDELLTLGKMGRIVEWAQTLAPEHRKFGLRVEILARNLEEEALRTLLNNAGSAAR